MNTTNSGTVGLLGSGTCRLSARTSQNSAYVKCSPHELLIIDAGIGVPNRIALLNLLDGVESITFHISHLHIDHLMGIFGLLQSFAWSDDIRQRGVKLVSIQCSEEVGHILKSILNLLGPDQIGVGTCPPASNFEFELASHPNDSDWQYTIGAIRFEAVHLPDCFNHGLRFAVNDVRYAFTCDATAYTTSLVEFLQQADVGVFDCGHLSNSWNPSRGWVFDPSPVVRLAVESQTPTLIATHHYLREHQEKLLSEDERETILQELVKSIGEQAKALGYTGRIKNGHDLMVLSP